MDNIIYYILLMVVVGIIGGLIQCKIYNDKLDYITGQVKRINAYIDGWTKRPRGD